MNGSCPIISFQNKDVNLMRRQGIMEDHKKDPDIEDRKLRLPWQSFLKDVLICSLRAYGGAKAHMSVFLDQMVIKKRYLSEAELIELIALCSILPGPTSTQTIMPFRESLPLRLPRLRRGSGCCAPDILRTGRGEASPYGRGIPDRIRPGPGALGPNIQFRCLRGGYGRSEDRPFSRFSGLLQAEWVFFFRDCC